VTWASAIGVGVAIAGLIVARSLGLAAGGTIVLVAAVVFFACAMFGARFNQQTARTDG
jgi:ABC-type Mn2+/Zn2+ transport system permease subunit